MIGTIAISFSFQVGLQNLVVVKETLVDDADVDVGRKDQAGCSRASIAVVCTRAVLTV
jgi:hypothetical protein